MAKGKQELQANLAAGEWEKIPTALRYANVSGLAKAVYFAILCDRDDSNFGTRHIAKSAGVAKSAVAKCLQELHQAKMIVWDRPKARHTGSIVLTLVENWESLSGHHADSSGHHADSSGHHADSSGHHADVIQTTDNQTNQTGKFDVMKDDSLGGENLDFKKEESKSDAPQPRFTFQVACSQLRGEHIRTADINLMVAGCRSKGVPYDDMDASLFIRTLWPDTDRRRKVVGVKGWDEWKANAKADFVAAVAREYFDRPNVAPKVQTRSGSDLDSFNCDDETLNQFFGDVL